MFDRLSQLQGNFIFHIYLFTAQLFTFYTPLITRKVDFQVGIHGLLHYLNSSHKHKEN